MAEFPFQLVIGPEREILTCKAVLRAIAGRREVYDAVWKDRPVIVKVFMHKISARRHLNREWRKLNLLRRRKLNCPEPLFYGKTNDRHLAMVVEKITESTEAIECFNKAKDDTEKMNLLVLICKALARQHSKGVIQKDLHLGNFLVRGQEVFAIDMARIHLCHSEPGRKKSLSQLALLALALPESQKHLLAELCRAYADERNWNFQKSDELIVQKQMKIHGARGIRRGLKKTLRTGKRIVKVKSGSWLAVFDRDFCCEADFAEQLDSLMDRGRILKNGNTCYVSHFRWNEKEIVVKRYNHKGFIHSLRHTIKRSRARRVWLHAHRLGMLNIATPRPLAYIEHRKGPLIWKSYLVTEFVNGDKLYDLLRDNVTDKQNRSTVNQSVLALLEKLQKHRITHGDLKHSNILITEKGPVLTDLDSMRVHKFSLTYKSEKQKDLNRFIRETPN